DAIAGYQRFRQLLGAEAGIEPGQRLQLLATAIARRDAVLDRPGASLFEPTAPRPPAEPTAPPAVLAPFELPRSEPVFTGRTTELASLTEVLHDATRPSPSDPAHPSGPTAVTVIVISGTAGVGKTALALHWARLVASQFPDGQLYIDLRGFDADDRALDPADVLWDFLRA